MIVENLRQFGLGEKEISVYLSLISLGPSPVRLIASKSGTNRVTTYDVLKALIDLGIVSYYKQYHKSSKKQYFVAEPPRKLLDAVEGKKRNLESLKIELGQTLPELESLYEKSGARPVVKYYEGTAGVRVTLQDVLEESGKSPEKKYFVYSSADIKHYLYKSYPNFNKDRINAKIANQVIAFGKGGELAGLDERKWIDKEHSSPTYIIIYSGKVAMISLDATKNPVGVIIENDALYETQKMLFEFIWGRL
ncbi:MAG: helix-turn-helix domain-containing protein [bacterium]|nr:helix-turn-helix domain-containing protein [bacterium]